MTLLKEKKTVSNNRLDYNLCQHNAKIWSLDKILLIAVCCIVIVFVCSSKPLLLFALLSYCYILPH